jgi:hypothetical protein
MPIALVSPTGSGEDFVCGPIGEVGMVRRRNAEDTNGLRIPAQACCAEAVAQKRDRSRGGAAFKAGQLKLSLNVRRSCGTDPGPAGFDWVEIDFRQTHFDKVPGAPRFRMRCAVPAFDAW